MRVACNVSSLKNDIFPITKKTTLHIIHRVSRASHGSVVCSLRTRHDLRGYIRVRLKPLRKR